MTALIGALAGSLLYPLGLGLVAIRSNLALAQYFVQEMPNAEYGLVGDDGRLALSGVIVEHAKEVEEVLKWTSDRATVLRFISGVYDAKHFRRGGSVLVWVELERPGTSQKIFERQFELTADAGEAERHEAMFALIRSKPIEDGSEDWTACSSHTTNRVESSADSARTTSDMNGYPAEQHLQTAVRCEQWYGADP